MIRKTADNYSKSFSASFSSQASNAQDKIDKRKSTSGEAAKEVTPCLQALEEDGTEDEKIISKSEPSLHKSVKRKSAGKKKQRRACVDQSRMYYSTYGDMTTRTASSSTPRSDGERDQQKTEKTSAAAAETNYQKGIAILSDLYGRLMQTEKERKSILTKIESINTE